MSMKKSFFTLVLVFCTLLVNAQYKYRDSNRIGITIGMNQFSLATSNFETKPASGLNVGLSVRGNYYNDWDMVYAMQFSENNFMVASKNFASQPEDVNYKLSSAQISLMGSYKIVENHLSVEFGPMIQVNGKLMINETQENNKIIGTTFLAKDITDISKFNFYPAVGITAGVRHFRVNLQYYHGVNNILGNLNKTNVSSGFKGTASIVCANLIIYL